MWTGKATSWVSLWKVSSPSPWSTPTTISPLNVVTAQQFYNGEVVIFITNDDKTNTVLVMQNDAAHAHMTAPFGYVLTEA
jgi:hypothetical protein